MAPASSLLLPVLLYWMASPSLSMPTAKTSSAELSPFIRSGVIPSEELPGEAAVEGDPSEDSAGKWDTPATDGANTDSRQSTGKHASSIRQQPHDSVLPTETQDSESFNSTLQKFSAGLRSSRPYVYDRAAKPLSPLGGEFTYPLYYTSYHLFAPSLTENTRPGIEYFGDPPDSYDSLYYGKYQRLAEDVFEQKFVQLRNAGDRRGDSYAETHRQKRRRKNRTY